MKVCYYHDYPQEELPQHGCPCGYCLRRFPDKEYQCTKKADPNFNFHCPWDKPPREKTLFDLMEETK